MFSVDTCSSCGSVSEPVGDRQQLVSLLHGLDFGVRRVIHGLVAAPGVIQKLLLRRLELADLSHLQVRCETHVQRVKYPLLAL